MQEEYLQKIQRTVLTLNQNGLSFLSNQQHSPQAYDYFKKAEKMLLAELQGSSTPTYKRDQLLAVTYNNLAIYYKRTNKPKAALTYLKKALQLQTLSLEDELAAASTHLNICAIYSFMNKHQQAMEHAELSILKAENAKNKLQTPSNKEVHTTSNSHNSSSSSITLASCDNVILASKYNLAVQYEYLKRYEEALQMYRFSQQSARQLSRKGILTNTEQAITRVDKKIKENRRHILQLILKKKENQERGHYESMRRNKKNIKNTTVVEDSTMQMQMQKSRAKRYQLYGVGGESTNIHQTYNINIKRPGGGVHSMEKIKRVKPLLSQNHNIGEENKDLSKQSSLPEINNKGRDNRDIKEKGRDKVRDINSHNSRPSDQQHYKMKRNNNSNGNNTKNGNKINNVNNINNGNKQ